MFGVPVWGLSERRNHHCCPGFQPTALEARVMVVLPGVLPGQGRLGKLDSGTRARVGTLGAETNPDASLAQMHWPSAFTRPPQAGGGASSQALSLQPCGQHPWRAAP